MITAGPTQEPIDQVRYLGNRSSGRVGIALAEAAAEAGWTVTLLLGPTPRTCSDSRVSVHRFRTTADLQLLLAANFPESDVLVMAAAVADYRPRPNPDVEAAHGKLRRLADGLTLQLEPTPDLLAACSARRTPGQRLVGFALEPRERLLTSAREKLARKGLDLIVANPLETMDAEHIEATVVGAAQQVHTTPGAIPKEVFARWLIGLLDTSR